MIEGNQPNYLLKNSYSIIKERLHHDSHLIEGTHPQNISSRKSIFIIKAPSPLARWLRLCVHVNFVVYITIQETNSYLSVSVTEILFPK